MTPRLPESRPVIPGETAPGGSFIVDGAGNLLAFDRALERLTGWHAGDVVGRHKDLGTYTREDDSGHRLFDLAPLYEGTIPDVPNTCQTTLVLNGKHGQQFEVQALITPTGGAHRRLTVQIQQVLARMDQPVLEDDDSGLDPLTRLPSSELFFEQMRQALERAQLFGGPLSLLIVSVDHYDALEQRVGLERGHQALRRLAGILKATLRGSDLVGRLRGDQFAVLLDGAGRSDARHIGGRIRRTVESFSFACPQNKESLHLTVSIGVACHPADGSTVDQIVHRAHLALEEVHRLGRNRVWCYARRPRVSVEMPVVYEGPSADLLGTTLDLSNSGAFIRTREMLPAGMRVGLVFQLPNQAGALRILARVVRQVPVPLDEEHPAGLGVEFEALADPQNQRLGALIGQAYAHPPRQASS